jgi:hypothetical protein
VSDHECKASKNPELQKWSGEFDSPSRGNAGWWFITVTTKAYEKAIMMPVIYCPWCGVNLEEEEKNANRKLE